MRRGRQAQKYGIRHEVQRGLLRFIDCQETPKVGLTEWLFGSAKGKKRLDQALLGEAAVRAIRKVVPWFSSDDFTNILPL